MTDQQRPTETNQPDDPELPSDATRTGDLDVDLGSGGGLGDEGAGGDDPLPGGADALGAPDLGRSFGGGGMLGTPGGIGTLDDR